MTDIANRQTQFQIPAENQGWFLGQIAKLSKRSVRLLGAEFAIMPVLLGFHMVEVKKGISRKIFDYFLQCEDPKIAGWEFVAKLDHANEVGTIVRVVPGKVLPFAYHSADHTNCDHCRTRRFRRDTYVVRNIETNKFNQVGSTCLKDFLGHDVEKIAKLAEFMTLAGDIGRAGTEQIMGYDRRYINLEAYLGFVAASIRQDGWISRADARRFDDKTATADLAFTQMNTKPADRDLVVSDKDTEVATAAIEWAQNLTEQRRQNDYLHNIFVISASGIIEFRSIGLAGSIVGAYLREQSKLVAKIDTQVDNAAGIIAFLNRSKLKHPKVIVTVEGRDLRLSIAGPLAGYPGTVNVNSAEGSYETREWYGRIHQSGRFEPSRRVQMATTTAILRSLHAFAADPAGVAAVYGKRTGNCCFCLKPLDDVRSTHVGYGRVCAKRNMLPYPTMKEFRNVQAQALAA